MPAMSHSFMDMQH